jgi:hypothetical protein
MREDDGGMSENPVTEHDAPSYHDLHVTTKDIKRVSIFDMPYGYEVTCTRVGGWQLWFKWGDAAARRVAGEYDEGLRLDVDGHVICDSLTPLPDPTP